MTIRKLLDLLTGIPLDTDVVIDGGTEIALVKYDAKGLIVTIVSDDDLDEYDSDDYDDYFTDEGEEDDDDSSRS